MPVPPPVTTQTNPETSNSLEASKWCVSAMLLIVWLGGEFGVSFTLQIFVFAWEFNLYLAVRSSTLIGGGAMMHDARFMTYSLGMLWK